MIGAADPTTPAPSALERHWPTILLSINEYAMHVNDAANHQSASKADIAQSSALAALGRLRSSFAATLKAHTERLVFERDAAQARYDRTVAILVGIHRLLYPRPVTTSDGVTMEFHQTDANVWMNRLSERIRAIPDELDLHARYDDTLLPFLALMRAELHANSAKGDRPGWLTMDRSTALLEIYWHTAKLSAACKNNDLPKISEHCADVANMAMMLADVCGLLTATPTQHQETPR